MNWFWTGVRQGLYVYEQEFDAPDLCEPGVEYGICLTVKNISGKRLGGRGPDGKSTKRVQIDVVQ